MNRYASFACVVLLCAASSLHASPWSGITSHLYHRSTGATSAPRVVTIVLDSQVVLRRQVQIGDTLYTLRPGAMQRFHVPVGTPVIARSAMRSHADGELLFVAKPETAGQRFVID